MAQHGSLANYVGSACRRYGLAAEDRVLQFSSLTFDASAEEIYPCLVAGGTLILRTDAMLATPSHFLRALAAWRVTVAGLATAYWHEITAHLAARPEPLPPSLRLLVLGGERARPESARIWWREVGATVELVNTYGPTEATIVATACPLPPPAAAWPEGRELPIGRPVANLRALVLDRSLRLSPIGAPGEVNLGGAGVTRGYLGRPALTAERFVPDAFSGEPGARLYRTGDRGRLPADGNLEFLGRLDEQVKLRGFRLEPGEIEAALAEHPAVRSAVVVLREEDGDRRLVAYLVPARGGELPLAELRAHLKARLPDYMVPAVIVALEALPTTPSGKVDRRRLPAPERRGVAAGAVYVAPEGPAEEALAQVFAQVLRRERVGRHDDFFELGGHSLLATQVVARVSDAFHVELPLRALFEAATVADLALVVEELVLEKIDELSEEEVEALR
jgi:acyl-coenzyme A synthetase/AMP-(fatty) acid ligase/acyl carrier protein